ncbi:MAG: TlpA family protein disulfide reductase [Betaproteobacteria bacterium]|nr:TlpA family protein disulfide reductase [Betaproteobacteria bacterium]
MPTRRMLLQAGAVAVGAVSGSGTSLLWPGEAGAQGASQSASPSPSNAATPRLPDRPAPAIGALINTPRTPLIDGTVIEANAFRGKVLLVQLWATWCPFCRKQNPLLDKLWRSRRSDGLELLGLSIDEKTDVIKRYLAEHDYRFPVARLDAAWWAAIGRPKGLPILWVIDRESRLTQVEIGEMFPEDIELLERWI